MLTAALLLLIQSPARVDVRESAAIGSVMAGRLGKQFGATVRAQESVADLPFIFCVQGVTFEEFRSLSSSSLDLSWREVNGVWEMYRSKEQADAAERTMMSARAEAIKKALSEKGDAPEIAQDKIDDLALKVKLTGDEELSELLYTEDGEYFPRDTKLLDAWRGLGAEYFMSLPLERRWVFTSDGSNSTKKLAFLNDTIRDIAAEYDRVAAAFKKSGAWERLESSANGVGPVEFLSWMGVGRVKSLLLEVSTSDSEVMLTLTGFDESGKSLVSYYDAVQTWEPQASPVLREAPDKRISFSPGSLALRKSIMESFEAEESFAPTAFIELLAGMPEREFLSYEVSDILIALADESGKPLLGQLSDDFMMDLGFLGLGGDEVAVDGNIGLRTALGWLDDRLQIEMKNGALVAKPERLPRFQVAFPRRQVADYVRANRTKRVLDLPRLPSLFSTQVSMEGESMAEIAFVAHNDDDLMMSMEMYLVVAWQKMSAQQKMMATTPDGTNITVSQAGDMMRREFLSNAINYGQWSMQAGYFEGDVEIADDLTGTRADFMFFDVKEDTFDRLQLNFRTKRVPAVFMSFPSSRQIELVTTEGLAEWLFNAEQEKDEDTLKELREAKFAIEDTLEIEMRYSTPVGVLLDTTTVQLTHGGTPRLTMQQLPSTWVEEYRRALDELRKGGGQPARR